MLFVNWQRNVVSAFSVPCYSLASLIRFYIDVALDPPVLRSEDISIVAHTTYSGMMINCFHLVNKALTTVRFSSKPKPADDLSQLILLVQYMPSRTTPAKYLDSAPHAGRVFAIEGPVIIRGDG